jgi:hypothetical protein
MLHGLETAHCRVAKILRGVAVGSVAAAHFYFLPFLFPDDCLCTAILFLFY